MEKISDGKYVELIYDLYEAKKPADVLLYKFTDDAPDRFVFGLDGGAMIQGFKDKILGLKAGDTFDFTLSPEEAFGNVNEEYVQEYPRSVFEIDGEFDDERIRVGETIEMLTADGHRIPCDVVEVGAETVTLDFNHPLAGAYIRFAGTVKTVREATAEELNPQQGCGCSCGDCGGSCDSGCGCN